ncbi:non-specific serine/threonine protein kinase [Parafrankia irregularis]|uniref:Non-specific serine/threonine protein kinase n=1 Tax=Parafrankia irregularis TaxID=795642 RepID=A0A0S4QRQ3_9ACTN|nr:MULTISPECIES: LuxR C-terminal-related transcriptional regulator [Parafrankia]MBE3201762.1 LuxR family transcriptional regulator [Parafrankia sp. CH37]CUU58241.1 non-specific serine/threonine protein kinase [Parafrankia irregularis]
MTASVSGSPQLPGAVLPTEVTSFVGRRQERADLRQRLGRFRLVTLVGVGGVGKTRLALRTAAEVRGEFPDGVWFVELAQLRDPDLLPHQLAATLGCSPPADRTVLNTLLGHLRERRLLLVLDNCEHLADACADLVDSLLRGCPRLRVLATSRESLRVESECTYLVAPFSVPERSSIEKQGESGGDAATLFLDRARAVRSGVDLTRDDRDAIGDICRLVDGIPLAIELAAVRLRALSPAEILRLLHEGGGVLRHDGRRMPDRRRTLRGCIDWSFDLCTGAEQRLWARLSVFAGGFELDAVEGVCHGSGLPEPVVDLILSLVDKSILMPEPGSGKARFRLLEMLRQYGYEKLRESGEDTAMRRAHRDWFLELATRAEGGLLGTDRRQWLRRLRRDHANLQRAMAYSAEAHDHAQGRTLARSLHYYWVADGRFDEGRTWLARFQHVDDGTALDRLQALHAAGWLATLQGDAVASAAILREGAQLAASSDDVSAAALITQLDGMEALYTGQSVATEHLELALERFRQVGDVDRQLETLAMLTVAAALGPAPAAAGRYHAECGAMAVRRREPALRLYTAWPYALAVWRSGDAEAAVSSARDALSFAASRSDRLSLALCLETIAWIEAGRGRHVTAAVLLGAADRLWSRMGTSTAAFPALFRFRSDCEADCLRSLGDGPFEAARAHGAELTPTEACSRALGQPEEGTPPGVASGIADRGPLSDAGLTRREREVVGLLALGRTNREIATELRIAPRTAESHVHQVLSKLGFHSRAKVTVWLADQLGGASRTTAS